MNKYYYLISSLPDIKLDDTKLVYTIDSFKKEIYPSLSKADKKLIDLYYLKYDNENFLKIITNSDVNLDEKGLYKSEDFLELISAVKNEENIPSTLPAYFKTFLVEYLSYQNSDKSISSYMLHDKIAAYYYDYAAKTKNKLVKLWFELNLNINNILSALTARKYKIDINKYIVGDGWVSQCLKKSTARDFGLSIDIDYVDSLIRISEIADLVEREKKLDLMKWLWLEENSFFNYFTIERLFVFLMQIDILERWLKLDKEAGNKTFREIIGSLKDNVKIPEEFKR